MKNNKSSVAFVSSYPPRQCGIATFTKDLTNALNKTFSQSAKPKIIAMDNNQTKSLSYPRDVIFCIKENMTNDYILAAKKVNSIKSIKIVNIQHEFGLYGGKYLNHLIGFLETINKPVFLTLHSVPNNPPDNIKNIIQYLALKVDCLIVMTSKAVEILKNDYGISNKKIVVIPHGIHEVPYEQSIIQKTKLGYKDRLLISSFGLITDQKNYETIIRALPKVVKRFPNLLYLIIGKTHPGILKTKGERYRNSLKKLIKELNLNNNIKLINRYVDSNELHQYLRATDIFVSSGRGLHQIVSGTLSYAMGCGRPVITIPFLHAKEVVTKDRGILVELGNSESYSKAIIKLLSNPELRETMGKNAYDYTRHMLWYNVAKSYMDVFEEYLS